VSRRGEAREDQRLDQHEGLQEQEGPAPIYPVGHDAAVEGEEQDRKRSQGAHQPDEEGGVGELQDQPPLRHHLHPRARERDELACEEEPELADREGGERPGESVEEGHRGTVNGQRGTVNGERRPGGALVARPAR